VPACGGPLSSGESSGYSWKSIEINASSPRIAIRAASIVAREGGIAAAVDPMEGAMGWRSLAHRWSPSDRGVARLLVRACCSPLSAIGTSATFTRRGAMSEVHSEAGISRIADPATLMSTRPRSPWPGLTGHVLFCSTEHGCLANDNARELGWIV